MPASSKKARKIKQDSCRDRKRAASIQNWLKKPWVREHIRRGLDLALKQTRNTVGALRKRQAELQKENASKAFDRVKSNSEKLNSLLGEACDERDAAKREARAARAEGKRGGEAAAWNEANKERCALQTALQKAKEKNRCFSLERARFLTNASRAQREAYHELAK
ncbi:unnamed protein product, partial [Prorocentrum cordatum]